MLLRRTESDTFFRVGFALSRIKDRDTAKGHKFAIEITAHEMSQKSFIRLAAYCSMRIVQDFVH